MERLTLDVVSNVELAFVAMLVIQSLTQDRVREAQEKDSKLVELREKVRYGEAPNFYITTDDILRYEDQVCVPDDEEVKIYSLEEAHQTPYTVHPGSKKKCTRT
jgi:hypothetical protein